MIATDGYWAHLLMRGMSAPCFRGGVGRCSMGRTPVADRVLLGLAVLLMLGGAALLIADVVSSGVTIPLITVGIALVVIAQMDIRRRGSHTARGV